MRDNTVSNWQTPQAYLSYLSEMVQKDYRIVVGRVLVRGRDSRSRGERPRVFAVSSGLVAHERVRLAPWEVVRGHTV